MPTQAIEQIRANFFAQMGINENTPISEADAPNLIDQWEQYLYSAAQQSAAPYQSAPAPRYGSPSYVPPGQRTPYQPGQIYTLPSGTYIGPPRPGSVVGPTGGSRVTTIPRVAPAYTGGGTPSGTVQNAPPPRY